MTGFPLVVCAAIQATLRERGMAVLEKMPARRVSKALVSLLHGQTWPCSWRGCSTRQLLVWRRCTLFEWLLRDLLNDKANMGVQNNHFVRKRPFFNGLEWRIWFQKFQKNKIQVPAKKNHSFSTNWVAMVAF